MLFFLLTYFTFKAHALVSLEEGIEHFSKRYPVSDIYGKVTDNRGNGFPDLYGTRNLRMVLKGVLYRGGGNNYYHREGRRDNMNPLPEDGLLNLCREGFSHGVYLYTDNYDPTVNPYKCLARDESENQFNYLNYPTLLSPENLQRVMGVIYDQITNYRGPIYVHCWNGWHASGYTSATALIQFCGMKNEDAVNYWDQNTDGNNTEPGYEKIRNRIRNFQAYPEYQIPKHIQALICP